ncbi:MAG: hypothetical protein KKG78_01485 [Alphaproteobacteria bacterium]|nr:hypothetical protein [Alphaproteobacteria bacterium]
MKGIGSAIAAMPAAPVFKIERREICLVAMSSSFAGFANPCYGRIWRDTRLLEVLQETCQFGGNIFSQSLQRDVELHRDMEEPPRAESGQPEVKI